MSGDHQAYLGDGVYVKVEHGSVVLTADGPDHCNRIVLEPQVIEALRLWIARVSKGAAALAVLLLLAVPAHAKPRTQLQVGLSARLCGQASWRVQNLNRMVEERRQAKLGGVLDLREIRSDQRSVREVTIAIAETVAALRNNGLRALSCRDPDVVEVEGCLRSLVVGPEAITAWGDPQAEACRRPAVTETVHFTRWVMDEEEDPELDAREAEAKANRTTTMRSPR